MREKNKKNTEKISETELDELFDKLDKKISEIEKEENLEFDDNENDFTIAINENDDKIEFDDESKEEAEINDIEEEEEIALNNNEEDESEETGILTEPNQENDEQVFEEVYQIFEQANNSIKEVTDLFEQNIAIRSNLQDQKEMLKQEQAEFEKQKKQE